MTPATRSKRKSKKQRAWNATACGRVERPIAARGFDAPPPIEPPECLKNRAPNDVLTNEECIEALEWLQACIRSVVITKGAGK